MKNPWKHSTFALAILLAAALGSGAVQRAGADVQPKMREALTGLKAAAASLEAADRDKGGHRAKALELTKAAIGEVEAGIKFDNNH